MSIFSTGKFEHQGGLSIEQSSRRMDQYVDRLTGKHGPAVHLLERIPIQGMFQNPEVPGSFIGRINMVPTPKKRKKVIDDWNAGNIGLWVEVPKAYAGILSIAGSFEKNSPSDVTTIDAIQFVPYTNQGRTTGILHEAVTVDFNALDAPLMSLESLPGQQFPVSQSVLHGLEKVVTRAAQQPFLLGKVINTPAA
jgi:hypothetical protein